MTQNAEHETQDVDCDSNTSLQVISLVIVISLLFLTAYGNAGLMFWLSMFTLLLLSCWFLLDRKIWLGVISSLTFIACVLALAKSLF